MIALPEVRNGKSLPDRVSELKKTVSASRLNCWQSCRLKFYFRYVLKLRQGKTAALFVGSVVHTVIQAWNTARWKSEPFILDRFQQLFGTSWQSNQERPRWNETKETKEKEKSWRVLEMYFRETPIPPDEKPEAVEVHAEADLSKHGLPTVIGYIDLVRTGGKVVDFKTTAQTPNEEKAVHLNETQLSCYGVLYRDCTGSKESGFELHQLVKLKKPKLVVTSMDTMTSKQETRLFKIMESYLNGLDRQDWVPSPSPMSCSCCEYFNECRRWS